MSFGLDFHHFGLALKNENDSKIFLNGMGYEFGEKIYDKNQNVNLIFCKSKDKPSVEIILPGIGQSPIDQILKRYDESIYHLCFSSMNLALTLELINKSGLRVVTISKPTPAILFDMKEVSFYHISGFGIVEIINNEM